MKPPSHLWWGPTMKDKCCIWKHLINIWIGHIWGQRFFSKKEGQKISSFHFVDCWWIAIKGRDSHSKMRQNLSNPLWQFRNHLECLSEQCRTTLEENNGGFEWKTLIRKVYDCLPKKLQDGSKEHRNWRNRKMLENSKCMNERGLVWQRNNEISLTETMLNIMFAYPFGNYTDGNLELEAKNKSVNGDYPECQNLIWTHWCS